MTSPVVHDPRYANGRSAPTPARRRQDGPSAGALAWARLRRGLQRQAVYMTVIAVALGAFGAWFQMAGGGGLTILSALAWIGVGIGGALIIGLVRELSRNTITSVSSLGKHRGYSVLGAAPELSQRAMRQLPPDQRSPLGCLAYQPASAFSTAFRDLQGNLQGGVVSFIGALAGEGATTAALCAAASATQQGRSVILIDCDLRRRSLTRGFGMNPDVGVLEACEKPEYWKQYVEQEVETGLHFIPAAQPATPWRTLIGQPGFKVLLNELERAYDLVVLDCPPALGSADGPMIARLAQRCVVVAGWDHTPLGVVRNTMRAIKARASTGVYVNRVPPGYRFGRLRPG